MTVGTGAFAAHGGGKDDGMARNNRSILVVGLGRFGSSVATTLDSMGQDVLAVDKDPELVNRWSAQVPTVQADMTDVLAVEQLNASDSDTAVVAIGDSVEASVITAGNLLDAGISDIWAKSVSKEHARILQRIGARHIINAETDAGKRVGHPVSGNYLDYIEIEGSHTVVKHPHAFARGRLFHRGRDGQRTLRRHRRRHQGARQPVPGTASKELAHAPQRRTRHHGQAGQHRQVHSRLTDARHPLHTPV